MRPIAKCILLDARMSQSYTTNELYIIVDLGHVVKGSVNLSHKLTLCDAYEADDF